MRETIVENGSGPVPYPASLRGSSACAAGARPQGPPSRRVPQRTRFRLPADPPREHVTAGDLQKETIEETGSVNPGAELGGGPVRHEKRVGRPLAKSADHQVLRRGVLDSWDEELVDERVLAACHEKKEPRLRKDADGSPFRHGFAEDPRRLGHEAWLRRNGGQRRARKISPCPGGHADSLNSEGNLGGREAENESRERLSRMCVPADPAERDHERERGRESAVHRISKEKGLAYERGEHNEGDSHGCRVGRTVSAPPGNRSPDEAVDRHARRERQERVQPPVAWREEREAPRHEKERRKNEVGRPTPAPKQKDKRDSDRRWKEDVLKSSAREVRRSQPAEEPALITAPPGFRDGQRDEKALPLHQVLSEPDDRNRVRDSGRSQHPRNRGEGFLARAVKSEDEERARKSEWHHLEFGSQREAGHDRGGHRPRSEEH